MTLKVTKEPDDLCGGDRHGQLVADGVDGDGISLADLALENLQRKTVADVPLDHPLERASAEHRVVAFTSQERLATLRDIEGDAARCDPVPEMAELNVDDLRQVGLREGPEPDDLVDPVHELGLEERQRVALQVRGHDEHGVGEVDGAALTV